MGMDLSVTIGPFIKVKGKARVVTVKVKRVCPNHPNVQHKEAKYCPMCGGTIENVDYDSVENLDPLRILYTLPDFEDGLWSPEGMEDLLIPNNYPPNKINFHTENGDVVELDNIDDIKTKQLAWFKGAYYKEIELLTEKFGPDAVKVSWGIVSYWG